MTVRPITLQDVKKCVSIYNYYITETTFTFECTPLTEDAFAERVKTISAEYPYLVCEEDGEVIGYAYLYFFSRREAYRFAADLSIYVAKDFRGKHVGQILYEAIEKEALRYGYRVIISIVTSENEVSLNFHRSMGFELCGELPKCAYKFGHWLGVYHLIKHINPDFDEIPAEPALL